jgi:GNAT superfamily N-acetyltransferase
MVQLSPESRQSIKKMFADYPYLRGLVQGVLAGGMGAAVADNVDDPKVAYLHLDFDIFAGDADNDAAAEMLSGMPRGSVLVVPNADWERLIRNIWGDAVGLYPRVAFGPGQWDSVRLKAHSHNLLQDYAIKQVTGVDVGRFAELAESLVYTYPTHEAFLAHGVGFVVEYKGKFVSGCSSLALGGGKLEIEIQTHPDFRRRGLATAVAAIMIEHCLDYNIEPCWDAANDMSAGLGAKLGFTNPTPYNAYVLR